MGEALKEIRLALLEADVNFKVVKELTDHVREKALGQEVLTALSPTEQVVKIVRDELITILGKDTAKLKFASQPPTVVLMAGLQGSGKTTTSSVFGAESYRVQTVVGIHVDTALGHEGADDADTSFLTQHPQLLARSFTDAPVAGNDDGC